MNKFGCIPPSLGNYGFPICKDVTGHDKPMRIVDKLIDCPKPCTLFKIGSLNQRGSFSNSGQPVRMIMKIFMNEMVTISTDQYAYTWLNLVAEVGGYVGLFLGYSVFQVADLLEVMMERVLLPRIIAFRSQLSSILSLISWL